MESSNMSDDLERQIQSLSRSAEFIEHKFSNCNQRDISTGDIARIIENIMELRGFLPDKDSQDAIDMLSDMCNVALMARQENRYVEYFEYLRRLSFSIKVLVEQIRAKKIEK